MVDGSPSSAGGASVLLSSVEVMRGLG